MVFAIERPARFKAAQSLAYESAISTPSAIQQWIALVKPDFDHHVPEFDHEYLNLIRPPTPLKSWYQNRSTGSEQVSNIYVR